jgi:hypothetical protein
MSILAHDWLGAFHLDAGFMSPLQGLLVGWLDPGAAPRLQRALPRAIPFRPGLRIFWGGMVFGLTESRIVDLLAGSYPGMALCGVGETRFWLRLCRAAHSRSIQPRA